MFYRLKMRRPVDEALKWYRESQAMKTNQTTAKMALKHGDVIAPNKVVEIIIEEGTNLTVRGQPAARRMLPFYSYEFYTFEVRSATAQGNNAFFDSKKQFEIEFSQEFQQYMTSQVLVINLIDEAVDITIPGARDYIGSVRIPLREILAKSTVAGQFPVVDESGQTTGELRLRISMQDAVQYLGEQAQTITHATKIQQEVVRKIVQNFSDSEFDDVNMILDMLFLKDNSQSGHVTKAMFKDFVTRDLRMQNVSDRELDLFLKTDINLQGKEILNRQDLQRVFDVPF